LANNNVIFRIPTPTFGTGLIETISEETLLNNQQTAFNNNQGITGTFNHNGNDGTISRFGWKAQNKSLELFAGEAYNVEQGVSNEIFPNERATASGCQYNAGPEDATDPATGTAPDTTAFAAFMRLSSDPEPATTTPSQLRGKALFGTSADAGIGCVHCHSDTLVTGKSKFTGMSGIEIHPYSDLAIHHMGNGLADGVSQGGAGGDQFRSAPLWGVGKRIFFLHDGRSGPTTGGLVNAILQHSSRGSEARRVIRRFAQLPASDQQAVINFLRSL
jgi:CxxC motif-containing protein (DUF1111 family)